MVIKLFFDLAGTGATYFNNLVGTSVSSDCKDPPGTFDSFTKFTTEASALDFLTFNKIKPISKLSAGLGVLTYKDDSRRTLEDTLGLISSVLSLAGIGAPFAIACAGFSFLYTVMKGTKEELIKCGAMKNRYGKPILVPAENITSPLVIDLNRDGIVQTNPLEYGIHFNLNAEGLAEKTGWVSSVDGLLALDLNGNGKIDSGLELFGNYTLLPNSQKALNGFEALQQYDDNYDQLISIQDKIWEQLKVWQDKNGNGQTDEGELLSLSEVGIEPINLNANSVNETNKAGHHISHRSQVNWTTILVETNLDHRWKIRASGDLNLSAHCGSAP